MVLPLGITISGVIVGIFIGVGRVDQQALLFVAPMIFGGIWLTAIAYVRRNNAGGNNNNTERSK